MKTKHDLIGISVESDPEDLVYQDPVIHKAPEDYRSYPALNYSELATFNDSPDHLFLPRKNTWDCQMGNATELYVYDRLYGTHQFEKRFFVSDTSGSVPDRLVDAVISGADITDMITLNKPDKDGVRRRNKKFERLHSIIDECLENPGLMPICRNDMAVIATMTENFFKLEIESDIGSIRLADFLEGAETQEPVVWQKNGVEKKCLPDFLVRKKFGNYLFDLKTAASFDRFENMLRNKYWIQDRHYSEGVRENFGGPNLQMIFIVLSKEKPYLTRLYSLSEKSVGRMGDKYKKLVRKYLKWKESGGNPVGWLPMKQMEVW